ncbi:hypothetical protein AYO44_11490 [Planctomycetaceae bacterium SCGC AG-212-F19]|nr:hypothetical protein AYO44_11490 [Planctomycetaceae bacterium SCGC AG-212-F19]
MSKLFAGVSRTSMKRGGRLSRRTLELERLEERTLPSGFASTTDGIHIFMDQLGNLSPQMTQFLATHVDGTQKQTPSQIAALRAVNPNFALVNYRLGTMAGPPMYIINGQWTSDWTTVTTHEDWFAHQTYSGEPQSAADLASGRIRDTGDNSYAMDISNVSWQNYWLTSELQNLQATGANGTFVDSFTYGIGGAGYDAPPLRYQGTNAANSSYWPGGVTWTDQLANWARTIENAFGQYNAAHGTDYKFIPNLDARATSWEPNWYYSNGTPFIDGAFLEGFGGYTDTYNWRLSMNRGLDLTRNDKIVIMQPYSSGNQQQLDFLIGTYLLLKGDHTYLAINGTSYYPEYQLTIGAPTTAIPSASQGVDGYLWNGVYRRDFQNGFVLVNPGSTTYSLNLGGTYQLVQGNGGGALSDSQLDANGNYIGGSLTYQNVGNITLVGGSAAIFLKTTTTNAAPTVANAASASPSQVAGNTTTLSALGADDGGEASLSYTWSSSGPAAVGFSGNGSNAAKNTTATFTKAGSYSFTVTIQDAGGLSVTSSVGVTVNQTLTSITVSPASATMVNGGTKQFAASAFDQFGQALSVAPAFTWSIASGIGTVSTTGLYTAPASGTGSAVVQAASGAVSAIASVTVQAAVTAPSIATQPTSTTVTSGQSVTFSVGASGTAPLTYQWQKSINGTWTNVGTNAATYSIASAAAADAGSYRVVVSNTAGSATSNTVTLTVNPVPTLPAPWKDTDIGSPAKRGSASATNGTFTVKGGGADIWNGSDQFNYAYQTLTGDGTIIARVASQQNTNGWAKAGVMIRTSTAANAAYAFAFITPGNGADFQYRTSAGAAAGWSGQISATAPEWVKLVRAGTSFTGYASTDGVTWTKLGSITISMGATVDVGLAVTAHNNSALSTATFTNVSITPALPTGSITVRVSEDAYLGDAQYTIAVDGQQIGGVRTATALHGSGQSQSVVLAGPYAIGAHTVSVTFLNDAYGGTAATDRNLYVDGIAFNGKSYAGGLLYSNGTLTFSIGT